MRNRVLRGPLYLTLTAYAGGRSDDSRFIIVPGHPTVDEEGVVTEDERFAVVEKPDV
jgi:hypothetical protein